MNRTLAFVLCAICSVGAAALTHYSYKPAVPSNSAEVGEPFFPDFTDPTKATGLRVAAYNTDAAKVDEFSVAYKDGKWVIPSHHNYPADGKTRLAKTAASLIGVTRGQLVSTTADAHKRLNLLDPLDKALTGTEGRGSRITITAGDQVLADYIIGKKDEDAGQDKYYVRRADSDLAYISEVKPDLSTKFVDWIQPNLLDATATAFRQLTLRRYHVDEAKGVIVPGIESVLDRDSSTDPWKLEGLDESMEKVKTTVVDAMTNALSNMKLVGVRRKPAGLGASLKGDEAAELSPTDELDMRSKGFFVVRGQLMSNEGDFLAGTADGVLYVLRFGEVFTGSEMEIEIGSPKTEGDAGKKDEKDADKKETDKKDGDQDEKKQNRYVFITAQFDEELLGEAPKEPEKPTPPPGYTPKAKPGDAAAPAGDGAAPTVPPAATEKTATEKTATEKSATEKSETPPAAPADAAKPDEKDSSSLNENSDGVVTLGGPPADRPAGDRIQLAQAETAPAGDSATAPEATPEPSATAPEATPAATEKPADATPPAADATPAAGDAKPADAAAPPTPPKDPNAEYEAALAKYEQELDEYRVKKAHREEQLKAGNEKVKKLNDRFADWYYVIPASLFKDLSVSAEGLVEPKDAKPATAAPGGGLPGIPGLPGASLPLPGTPPVTEETKATEEKTAEEKATEEKPAGETGAEEKPGDEKPADAPAADNPAPPATETEKPADASSDAPPPADEAPAK
jgi:hypothetical protein